ncbi:nucleopolyhedrovirus P10 family protein [Streptomyces lasiicapitis]|uniref:nucleopolyhedrovirus P10 family protein n=1 Tax=Streptomyces lasiicapitis TaxID=1923961 RepID=UPI00368C422B
MTGDGWTSAVRRQLGLGRVLPLGGPGDGAWLAESAARAVLRGSAERVAGVRLTGLRVSLADPDAGRLSPDAYVSTVPSPPSALPPGPLRISADFTAVMAEPLPAAASRLRTALGTAAADRLGLVVAEVDLRVTGLLDENENEYEAGDGAGEGARLNAAPGDLSPEERHDQAGQEDEPSSAADSDEGRVARAVLAVPGVTRMAGTLEGLGRAVHIEEHAAVQALPRRHVRVEVAADAGLRTLDVARAVRATVTESLPDRPSVAVLVTAVD